MNQKENFKNKYVGGGAAVAGAGLGMLSNSGNNERCPLDDNSFFCQLSRFASMVSMIIYIIVVFSLIVYIIYVIYSLMTGRQKTFF